MRAVCRSLLPLAFFVSACCWGASKAHLIVPLGDDSEELRALADKVGAEIQVITTTGDEIEFAEIAGPANTLHGRRLDGDRAEISLPFESLALVYYTEPSTDNRTPQSAPKRKKLPFLARAGEQEGNMTCSQLDTELARAEAIRWYARSGGSMPSERIHRNPAGELRRVRGRGTGVEMLALALCSIADVPLVGPCGSKMESDPKVLSLETTDDRIIGLLRLKAEKACEGHATVQSGMTDLDIWMNIDAALASPIAETAALDLLGPKPQPATRSTYEIEWIPNLGHSLDRIDSHVTPFWRGSLELSDREAVLSLHELDRGERVVAVEERSLRLPYAAITAVGYDEYRGSEPVVVFRWNDGDLGSLRLVREPSVKNAERFRQLRQLQGAVGVKAAQEMLVRSRADEPANAQATESRDSSPGAAAIDAGGHSHERRIEAVKSYDHAAVMASGRSYRGAATLTQDALVFPAEDVPYAEVASVQPSATTAILTLTSGRKIVVALFSDDGYLHSDPARIRDFREELEARIAVARK